MVSLFTHTSHMKIETIMEISVKSSTDYYHPSDNKYIFTLLDSVKKREAMHNSYALYGYNYLPYKYGSGFYTPTLALHKYNYGYVSGYGPRAYSYSHRSY